MSHSSLPKIGNVSDKICFVIQNNILRSVTFFRKSCHLSDNVEQYGRAGQATHDNMADAQGMLDN